MKDNYSRRKFLTQSTVLGLGSIALGSGLFAEEANPSENKEPLFKISLAQWSFHRAIHNGSMDTIGFITAARDKFGINAVEYVNTLFRSKPDSYWKEMKRVSDDKAIKNVLVMVDDEGALGDSNAQKRSEAIDKHKRWLEAAKELGCHGIRVNANSSGNREEQAKLVIDGLTRLADIAQEMELNIMVENHGGLSSHGDWLADVMRRINRRNCGTLPDFGNFYEYDRYQGVKDLMPFALGVSSKTFDFDANGNETSIDFERMLRIVLNSGFRGYVDIEYEGSKFSEEEGIWKSCALLRKLQKESLNWKMA